MSNDDTLAEFRRRLEAALKFRNTNAKALALAAGVGETVVRDILKGLTGDIKLGTVQRLATALDLSVADLVPMRAAVTQSERPPLLSASAGDGGILVRQVDLSYSMGDGTMPDDFPDEIPVLFDPNFLRTLSRAPADRLFVARGSGDSMFPTLVNGDQVMIDTTQRTLNMQDRLWALSVHGASMIKRLRTISRDRIRILSDNPTVPSEEVDAADVHIVGRVIWMGRMI